MRIENAKVLERHNIHAHFPVAVLELDLGEYGEWETVGNPGFGQELLKALPGLMSHSCSLGRSGGFAARLREGTRLGHVVEHVALELQRLAGGEVSYGKTRQLDRPGRYLVVYEIGSPRAGIRAGQAAVELVASLMAGCPLPVPPVVDVIRCLGEAERVGPTTEAIIRAARCRGVPVLRLDDESLLQLGLGAHVRLLRASLTDRSSCIAVDLATDKDLTKRLLSEVGIPVPPGRVAVSEADALAAARDAGTSVALKPSHGNQGKGVTLNLREEGEIRLAYRLAVNYGQRVLVERFVPGRHYRLLVVGGQVVAAAERFPPRVEGDGRSNVLQLIEAVNRDPKRGHGHEKPLTRIQVDEAVLLCLSRQGLDLDHVIATGRWVNLRESANLSTGGTAADVTEQVHPENARLAVEAARVIGLDVAGVDIVADDIGEPLAPSKGAVIEVNASPGLRMHLYPSQGRARDVAGAIVDTLFPPGKPSRIPIISVTGTNGKTTVCRMAAHVLNKAGMRVGMTCTDGIFVEGRLVVKTDASGPRSARVVLGDSRVDAAVLETARGGIIRSGLGYDEASVGIVTNVSPDHEGQDGADTLQDIAHAKSLVVETIARDGKAVLSADDPLVRAMACRARGEVVLVSMGEDNPWLKQHLAAGGKGVGLRAGYITLLDGARQVRLDRADRLPLTFNGKSRSALGNALFAAAGVWALGLSPDAIASGLRSFPAGIAGSPGRFNLYEVGCLKVLVDYGHNRDAWRAALDLARSFSPHRLWGVIGAPGDRRSEVLRELGRVAGRGLDRIIIKEDQDRRGRQPGEVARIILEGVMDSGFAPSHTLVILDEVKALEAAMAAADPGDLVIVFYEEHERILQVLERAFAIIRAPALAQGRI
jgi:cyanophycin synthetase